MSLRFCPVTTKIAWSGPLFFQTLVTDGVVAGIALCIAAVHAARIRNAKDTGLRKLPLKGYAQNQVWWEVVALACVLLAWTQVLA